MGLELGLFFNQLFDFKLNLSKNRSFPLFFKNILKFDYTTLTTKLKRKQKKLNYVLSCKKKKFKLGF